MLQGKNVLIVEDAKISRDFLKEIIIELKADHVVEAENGQEGVAVLERAAAENKVIDFILCDINMPIMTGTEFLKVIKADDRFKEIPVIMTTAEGETSLVLEVIALGVKNYIVKPVTPSVLIEKISSIVKK